MKDGMLWFDDRRDAIFEGKVNRAAAYFAQKYDRQPTVCAVNEKTPGRLPRVGTIEILTAPNVQRDYFWIGVEDAELVAAGQD